MTRHESEFIHEVLQLMGKCPQVSPNPMEMTGWIHATRDYEKIQGLVYCCLDNFVTYSSWKHKLGSDDVDEYFIIRAKEKYEEYFEELKAFVTQRVSEGWA